MRYSVGATIFANDHAAGIVATIERKRRSRIIIGHEVVSVQDIAMQHAGTVFISAHHYTCRIYSTSLAIGRSRRIERVKRSRGRTCEASERAVGAGCISAGKTGNLALGI